MGSEMCIIDMVKKEMVKQDVKKEVPEEVIAKKITGDDLKKQNKLLIILAFIFTGLVVGITSVIVLIPIITNGKQAVVPDVSNMSVKEAIDALQKEGFTVADKKEEKSSVDVAKDKVISTKPEAGNKRKSGTEVTLVVSLGDTQITIEDYTGESFNFINGKLTALGIKVYMEKKSVEEDKDKDYEDGKIIDQSVKAGEKLSVGQSITLYVPDVVSKYPDFTDGTYTISDVQDFADTYQLELEVDYVKTNEYEAGEIFYQSKPKGFTIVVGNQSLKIKVAQPMDDDEENDDCGGLC